MVFFPLSDGRIRALAATVAFLALAQVLGFTQRWTDETGFARAAPSDGPVGIIDTLAGGGPVGDGGPAKSARFNLPGGISEAPNGDLVVVDFGNHRVRRIDHLTGVIETIAGTGEAGYNGDGIPAHMAQLARPEYAVYGPDGDLFVADSYNNRIRRIDHRTGLISTVAGTGMRGFYGDGGPATSAELHFPEGIAVDKHGNLFIADTVNRRIRRVDAESGIIVTYAGTSEIGVNAEGTPALKATFLRLARIAVDRSDNVYVADSPSHRILRIDAATRKVHTLAGTGQSGYSGDGGRAINARLSFPEGVMVARNDRELYFADVGNHRVRRIDLKTGVITLVAGTGEKGFSGDGGSASKAQLWSPGRVWVDRAGNTLIADILNARIRRVSARTGAIETIAGTGEWGDGGPARDALLSVPGDVVYSANKVYIADYGTRRVRCVDLATGRISTVAGGGQRTGEGILATEADLLLPEGIAVDGGKVLYIGDSISNKVLKVDLKTGVLRTLSSNLRQPSAVAIGFDGTVYFAEFGRQRVWMAEPKTEAMSALQGRDPAGHPLDIAATSFDVTGEGLFLLTHGSNEVRFFDLQSRTITPLPKIDGIPPSPTGDSQFLDIAVRASYAYLADPLAHRVLRLDLQNSQAIVLAGSGIQGFSGDNGPADRASLFQPGGVAISDDGRQLFIADTKNHRVRVVRMSARESQ